MATKYQDVSYGSFGGGMDQLSPESKIPDEYVELLDNMDPTPNGSLVKRSGTQLYGSVPVRVERIEYLRAGTSPNYTGELCLFLDTSVDVINLRSTPIFVYGRTSQGQAAGDFTSVSNGRYYPKFTTDVRQAVIESNGTTEQTTQILLEGNTHDQGPLLAFGLFQSISSTNLGNQLIYPTDVKVNKATADVTADVVTGLVSESSTVLFDTFAVAKSRAADPGTSYVHTATVNCASQYSSYQDWVAAGSPVPVIAPFVNTPNVTISISAATHNLSSYNILVDCYLDDGIDYIRITPDSYTITTAGSVEISFAHWQNFNLVACLETVPAAQSVLRVIDAGAVEVPIIFDYPETPFILHQMFQENLDGSKTSIFGSTTLDIANTAEASTSLSVRLLSDDTSDYRSTFYITNRNDTQSLTVFLAWDYARLISNKLCVEASDPVVDTFQVIIPGSEHRLGDVVSTVLLQSTNPTNENNLLVQYDEATTTTSDDTVAIDVSNNTSSQFTAYVALADRSVASGAFHAGIERVNCGTTRTFTITAATHNKGTNVNLALYKLIPGATLRYEEVSIVGRVDDPPPPATPVDGVVISASGDITVTITNNTYTNDPIPLPVDIDYLPVVYAVPNVVTIPSPIPAATLVSAGPPPVYAPSVGLFTLTGLTSAFPLIHVYQISGTNRIRITPDRISVNSILGTATIQVTNSNLSTLNISAYWDYSDYTSEVVIPLTASSGIGYSDDNPQMTIWGIPHKQLYAGATGQTPGYVTHVDTYRAQAEERAVCGLGGNLFQAVDFAEAPASYGLKDYYPNLRARVGNEVTIGPAFINVTDGAPVYNSNDSYPIGRVVQYEVNSTALYYEAIKNVPPNVVPTNTDFWEAINYGRTQGVIQFVTAANNSAAIVSSTYLSGNNVSYRLYVPDLTVIGSLSQIFNSSEFLTVSGMGYSINNGDFQVVSASLVPSTDYLDVVVVNPEMDTNDWNEANSDGRGGIFTDRIPLETTCPFFENDRLLSASWGEEQLLTVTGTSAGNEVRMDGLYENITIPDGLLLVGARTSRIIPIRSINAIPTTSGLVAGDILSFTGLSRELRSKFVNPRPDETVNIPNNASDTSDNPSVFVNVADSNLFQVGQRILLLNAGQFTDEQIIKEIVSPTQLKLEVTARVANQITGAIIFGYNVEVDEEFDWYDSLTSTVSFRTARRWWPVEEPDTDYLQLPPNRYRYFNSSAYDNQPFLRSTMVQDTMFLTNGLDAVQRYDGQTLTRAGLFRWQPSLYLTVDTSVAKIIPNTFEIDHAQMNKVEYDYFEVDKYLESHFNVGEKIRYSNTTGGVTAVRDLTIVKMWEGNTKSYIQVDISGKALLPKGNTGSIRKISVYSYYYRLNILDINNNVIASAVTGAEDARVEISSASTIRHLVLRPPFLDNFDFSRIELQIYRTKANGTGPYYLVTTLQPSWNQGGEAYVEYKDTENDNSLLSTELDAVTTTLMGQELGQTWTGPLRSKYVTSNSNSLVLANFRSWPSMTITPQRSPLVTSVTISSYNNRTLLLRKSNTDTGLTTDNLNRMKFQFVTNGAHTISLIAAPIDYDSNELRIPSLGHGLQVGDWVYLFYSDATPANIANVNPRLAGHYQVSSVIDDDAFNVQISNSLIESIQTDAIAATDVNRYVHAVAQEDVPVWLGLDRCYGTIAGLSQNDLDPMTFAFLRLANAINSAQAACSVTGFIPWVVANAGGEYRDNQIVLETPYVTEERLEAVLPIFTDITLFVNGVRVDAGATAQAQVQVFPSRLLVSYPNYPELFDSPTSFLDTDSDSAIDVNPSDGQQITGVIPFFAESAFGAAQKDAILLVFKTASVYLVNIAAKRAGQPCVQRLDTRGIGCTAPYSIAPTQNGIMFANQSGIYRITTGLQCQYIGRRMERVWKEDVDLTELDLQFHGHYYSLGNQYKLSVPYKQDEDRYSQRVLVYNTVREYTADGYRDGSWTSYSNMPSIGWANMLTQPLFATPFGEVFTVRMTGDSTDYRDDGAPIQATATLRAMDFGSASIRKMVASFNLQFRPEDKDTDAVVESAIDLIDNWETLDSAVVSRQRTVGNLNNRSTQQLSIIQYMSNKRKGVYYQLRVSNGKLDQGLQVSGVSMMVAGLGAEGIIQARETGTSR